MVINHGGKPGAWSKDIEAEDVAAGIRLLLVPFMERSGRNKAARAELIGYLESLIEALKAV